MDDAPSLVFYFDYVDPGSYLTHRQLGQLLPDGSQPTVHPLEVCPVPQELIDGTAPDWIAYEKTVARLAQEAEIPMAHPTFIPWSRKAHELRLHAAEKALEPPMHEEIFSVRFQEGADIGRIDVLVAAAERVGLDVSESKAVLDIDKHRDRVVDLRQEAERAGIKRVPTLRSGDLSLEGPASIGEVRHFLEHARLL
ncbi:MAG: DsbA family protein [Gemmatimonadetes bacterium]|nr:DsbA family protein [Gemmatimonadota bacterium]